ncbi:hypothetical protein P152DRAFT_462521 [Eremomyces bilateralis CBS 781.70]|uniref:Uncharacterized protein n=1 Tax=Eremomyces bilateralis CBS 781.70 TaxID=1392243 RepID=A0A6G1FRU2_9PEZI|nr:uncharacterized protein P152DRAFT_462521 [Eremomyces bilateralis CBS 781.70]KAF1808389.1 hypothetical protein P152DRAFT_462521 [Eremomyces bilateralis CBS 781.70]
MTDAWLPGATSQGEDGRRDGSFSFCGHDCHGYDGGSYHQAPSTTANTETTSTTSTTTTSTTTMSSTSQMPAELDASQRKKVDNENKRRWGLWYLPERSPSPVRGPNDL